MAFNDAALVTGANAIEAEITEVRLHSAAPDAGYTTNIIAGSALLVNGAVDADADITWTNLSWTGLAANQPVTHVSYWTGPAGATPAGANRGGGALTGDTAANSAGEFSIPSITENGSAS